MSKPENGKTKDASMTQDEDEDLASEINVRREDEAFAKEVKGLNRDGLIRLIIHDRLEIDRLWLELFKLRALKRRPAQESAKTKKANNPSAIVFGVKDFPALVLQAVDASRNSGIKEVRKNWLKLD